MPSRGEAALFVRPGESEEAVCQQLSYNKAFALKDGSNGSYVFYRREQRHLSGYRVEEADSAGAGDTYDGAFSAALMDGKDLWSAGEYATAAGAVAVTRRGLMDIAPTREDIAAMMSRGRSSNESVRTWERKMDMRVVIGYDPNAGSHARVARDVCESMGITVVDMRGEDPIYANTAIHAANMIVSGQADRGILICGTGIGMSIAANKVRGVYAALISDAYSAVRAEKSNNANIACFGAFTLDEKVMESLLRIWLSAEYQDGTPSAPKVQRIVAYENEAAHDQHQ